MKDSLKIIICDDDGTTRYLLRMLLREYDYDVVGEASNGMQVLDMCVKLKPDVLFLDINMPKMSGIEVLREIEKKKCPAAIIMISAMATADNLGEALSLGAKGFIVKPFNADKVLESIRNAVKKG